MLKLVKAIPEVFCDSFYEELNKVLLKVGG